MNAGKGKSSMKKIAKIIARIGIGIAGVGGSLAGFAILGIIFLFFSSVEETTVEYAFWVVLAGGVLALIGLPIYLVGDRLSQSPLLRAVRKSDVEEVRRILQSQPKSELQKLVDDQDSSGMTSLMHAAMMGKTEVVKILLEAGASLDMTTGDGETSGNTTALKLAARWHRTETLRLLLEAGADRLVGGDLLAWVVDRPLEGDNRRDEALQVLLDAGVDPDSRFTLVERVGEFELTGPKLHLVEDATMLIAAALADREGAIQLLLKAGADPSLKDSRQRTAMDAAKSDAIKRMLERGIDAPE